MAQEVDDYLEAELAFLNSESLARLALEVPATLVPRPLTDATAKLALFQSIDKYVEDRLEKRGAFVAFLKTYRYKNAWSAYQDLLRKAVGIE